MFNNVNDIKKAVDAGKTVHWGNTGYKVVKGTYDYCIVFHTGDCVGLTDIYGNLNEDINDFFYGVDKC